MPRRRKPKRYDQMTLAELDRAITALATATDTLSTLFREAAAAPPETLVPDELRRKAKRLDQATAAAMVLDITLEMRGMGATRVTIAKLDAMEDRVRAIHAACSTARSAVWRLLPAGVVPPDWIRAKEIRERREAAETRP